MTGLLRSKCCHECWPFSFGLATSCCYSTVSFIRVSWNVGGVPGFVILRAWHTGTIGIWTVNSTGAFWSERPTDDPLGWGAYAEIQFGPHYGWTFYHEAGGDPINFLLANQTCCTATYSDGGDTYSLQLKNNRCEIPAVEADLVVAGTLSPDATGYYDIGGTHNGQNYYVRQGDGAYLIYLASGIGIWRIGPALDDWVSPGWYLDHYTGTEPLGPYEGNIGGSTGTATVSLPPACQSTQKDQC